ncbi:glycosyl transferase family protein [Aquisediminimonas profunda]|uniref:glycosyl transferase family protein n=1 Tax=Aquisediminimonas profunda TaxID=1550733 RepID=UPI001C629477|nr:glycosyl transferase family protein [Aquisediminimonas profunda]
MSEVFSFLEISFRELALFAGVGIFLGSLSEILLDLVAFWVRVSHRRLTARSQGSPVSLEADKLGPFAVFVPAWNEADVIGQMLDAALISYTGDDVHMFVGCYPNDPNTISVVRKREGEKISLVLVDREGGTAKAHCLNNLYRALLAFEQARRRKFAGIILHDAEDVISADEVNVFRRRATAFAMIQLPVYPLRNPASLWISGHYCDEFAEAHGKTMIARQAIGAALPSAGVGCMFRRDVIEVLATICGGEPFSEDSLTEDYELGLRLRDLGFNSAFIVEADKSLPGFVCTQAYFPHQLASSVKQKARWMAGIGLEGWMRLGWGSRWSEIWMRARDRRGLVSAVILVAAYLALLNVMVIWLLQGISGLQLFAPDGVLGGLLLVNFGMAMWRLAIRSLCTWRYYGWREAALSIPRVFISNFIGILAAFEAVRIHLSARRTGQIKWEKTMHVFPSRM